MTTSSRIQPSSEDIQTGRIVGIQLGIPSSEDIVQQSVMEIATSAQGARVTTPQALGGLFDAKMGVTKAGDYCPTDGHTYLQCPGYFGHLWLARPVYLSQYTRFIVKVLSLVCWNCSTCLFDKERHGPVLQHMNGTERMAHVTSTSVAKARRCPRCNADQPKAWKESKDTVGEIRPDWRQLGRRAAAAAAAAAGPTPPAAESRPETVDAMLVFYILDRIDDDTINLIGMHSVFARPSSMVCRVLPIAPPAARPSREMDGGQRSEDDLTTMYINVIKYNANLAARIEAGAVEQDIARHIMLLQYAVGCIYSNKFPGGGNLTASSGRPMVSISDRHDGKQGRARANLNGKRVDFTARSVISGNPTISVVELGVALMISMTITVPEVVTKRNKAYLTQLVKNGPDQWPGANSVVQTGRGRYKRNVCLRSANRHLLVLRTGDVVNRHQRDGDVVAFNRQPSLHKASLMAHIVRVMRSGQSFRLNLAATQSYNADFDGDEMNMHQPQGIAATNELQCIAIVSEQMVDPSKNTPNLSFFQDNMLGLYKFSADGLTFTLPDAMHLLVCNTTIHLPNLLFGSPAASASASSASSGKTVGGKRGRENEQPQQQGEEEAVVAKRSRIPSVTTTTTVGEKRGREQDDDATADAADAADHVWKRRVTSLEILSQTLPPITHTAKAKNGSEVKLRNGQWLSGQADQTAIGAGSKGILHRICNDFGKEACVQFIDNVQNLVTLWITHHSSFSVGTGDLHLSPATLARIDRITQTAIQDVDDLQKRFQLGLFENSGVHTHAAEFESQVWNILSDARKNVEEVGGRGLAKGNRFLDMVMAGSKGKMVNITQMAMALGQQAISGARAPYGFEQRTLPAFAKFDGGALSGGFIARSYARGLSPVDYFLHAVAGREGLIDTAIKTSETGYTARRLRTLLEIDEIRYDSMVRDHGNRITQFRYGDDGFHSEHIEEQPFPLVTLDLGTISMRYDLPLWGNNRLPGFVRMFTPEAAARLEAEREETMRMCLETTNYLVEVRDAVVEKVFRGQFGNTVHLPMNIPANIELVRGLLGGELENTLLDLTPLEAMNLVREFDDKLVRIQCGFRNPLLTAAVHFWLNPKELLLEFRFNRAALVMLLGTLELRFKQALAPAGETVGVNAAQCIAEPVTQLTLNTFHSTGLITAKTTGTKGVSRIMEIISATENTKKPSMTLFLLPGDETSRARASEIANQIACLVLDTVVSVAQIVYDPVDRQTQIADDVEWMREFHAFQDMFLSSSASSASSASASSSSADAAAQLLLDDVESSAAAASSSSSSPSSMSSWIIRLELNARTMLDKNVSMDDVHYAVDNYFDGDGVQIAYADFNNDRLVLRVRTQTLLSSGRASQAGLDASDHLNYLKRAMLGMLQNVVLRGVRGVAAATPRKMTDQVFREDGAFVRRDTWVIDTDGSNLPAVLALDDLIDVRRVQCNNIREVHMTLGIECTRDTIIREFTEVMGDVKVNYHHLSLLADRMCMTANMVGAVHGGLNSDATGPLAHMSFERHSKMSVEAAVHGELDNMRGLTANIMCGQRGLFGTGAFNVLVDVEALARNRVDWDYDLEDDDMDAAAAADARSNKSRADRTTEEEEDAEMDVDAGLAALDRAYTACQNVAITNNLEAAALGSSSSATADPCFNDGYEMF